MTFSAEYYRALVAGQARGFWPGVQRLGLRLVSVPYELSMRARNRLYEGGWKASYRVAVPVVCVGNLTLGGTGKTPCVEYVARFYRRHDRRVALLSRGYGNTGGRNDEAFVLEENLPDVPHLQGADRVALAMTAVEELESEILVLDDGFQHRRLRRDLDLVLLDATNPWGHGYFFPRGLLREPPSSLRRAGAIVLTRCDQVTREALAQLQQEVARLAPQVGVVETIHEPVALVSSEGARAPLQELATRAVAAFCGIGNPEAFRKSLEGLGARVSAFRVYPDHHPYTRADIDALQPWAGQQAKDCVVVTTQKDLVKLRLATLGGRPLWALQICLQIKAGQEVLERKLEEVLQTESEKTGTGLLGLF